MYHSIRYKLKGYYQGMNEQQMRECVEVYVLTNGKQEYEVGSREDVEKLIAKLKSCISEA